MLNYESVGPGGQDVVLLRRRHVGVTREELERPELGEARELEALRHNVSQLHRESGRLRAQLEYDRTVHEEELGALRSRAEAAESMIESVRRSRSWRLTALLRSGEARSRTGAAIVNHKRLTLVPGASCPGPRGDARRGGSLRSGRTGW